MTDQQHINTHSLGPLCFLSLSLRYACSETSIVSWVKLRWRRSLLAPGIVFETASYGDLGKDMDNAHIGTVFSGKSQYVGPTKRQIWIHIPKSIPLLPTVTTFFLNPWRDWKSSGGLRYLVTWLPGFLQWWDATVDFFNRNHLIVWSANLRDANKSLDLDLRHWSLTKCDQIQKETFKASPLAPHLFPHFNQFWIRGSYFYQ